MKRFVAELVAELVIFELCWKGTHRLIKGVCSLWVAASHHVKG